ncbi:MAG: hypothetical protein BWK76_28225 [Desulfobulbaceae bacterium A2]|nr:MAG: hypothetical protein BWK76_28225 [Desulfobulbaceae bacterium A2]
MGGRGIGEFDISLHNEGFENRATIPDLSNKTTGAITRLLGDEADKAIPHITQSWWRFTVDAWGSEERGKQFRNTLKALHGLRPVLEQLATILNNCPFLLTDFLAEVPPDTKSKLHNDELNLWAKLSGGSEVESPDDLIEDLEFICTGEFRRKVVNALIVLREIVPDKINRNLPFGPASKKQRFVEELVECLVLHSPAHAKRETLKKIIRALHRNEHDRVGNPVLDNNLRAYADKYPPDLTSNMDANRVKFNFGYPS